jgi:DNA polymerase III subunit gamma/tau
MDPSDEGWAPPPGQGEAEGPGLFGDALAAPVKPAEAYRVLARKYRPQTFDQLIGQYAMVRTLRNAFESGRIAHGFILTGVRGVGKTTTARIIAKGLNCEGPDPAKKGSKPTVDPCGVCGPCRDIAESRAMDVLEMDAASRTGIDDIRELIEGARYAPVTARYKVYIIDEVHMLSKAAFNGLLKTLEEPPPHVVFIFATTEIRKVPVTVLSRCQRFDLRRVEAAVLIQHLAGIAAKEGAAVEKGAIGLIARAAEGSVRDALSLLDQALSLRTGPAAAAGAAVSEAEVRDMLGLIDRARLFDLFEALMAGRAPEALRELGAQYEAGADPLVVLQDLLALTHWVSRLKLVPEAADDATADEQDIARGRVLAASLEINVLTRAFTLLLKGIGEVQGAPDALPAAEMVLIKLAFAAGLPTPDEALRALKSLPVESSRSSGEGPARPSSGPSGGGGAVTATAPLPAAPAPETGGPRLARFEDVVAEARAERDALFMTQLESYVHLVRFEPGLIEFCPADGAPADLAGKLTERLLRWTGRRWAVSLVQHEGRPTLAAERRRLEEARRADASQDPTVAAILAAFPGAQITAIRDLAAEALVPDDAGEGFIPDPDEEER